MRNHTTKAILLGAMLIVSAIAHAQYAWLDEKGVRQYSDQPPPTNTPAAKILKMPHGMAQPKAEPKAEPAAPASAAKPAPTLAEREADYKKRHAESSESDKKAAAEKKTADNKRASCEAAAQNKAQLDTGRRLRAEGNVMTEEDKAKEQARIATILKDCK
ncbi:DUF4124 domain-containing protein [Massilia sp. S19_KUP03_FR1]|uniref:DUF4124 domain-containing protein n=1 Tax=Massilia sp. S19_KUP03_FR1 TaxID=3025503 RepID=UPI002FCD6D73